MDPGRSLSKLTEREKQCLRAWLDHKTAKEIALDLGISHYAVEKRLKMARVKLDVASSIDAARMLAANEGYQQTGPQAPDLGATAATGEKPSSRPKVIGVLVMSFALAAATAVLLTQPLGDAATSTAEDPPASSPQEGSPEGSNNIKVGLGDLGNVEASPERVRHYVRQMFDREDKDRSGYVERSEASTRIEMREPRSPESSPQSYSETKLVKVFEGDAARTEYIRGLDLDGDDRISFEEYSAKMAPHYEQRGIPLIPADWAGCCQPQR